MTVASDDNATGWVDLEYTLLPSSNSVDYLAANIAPLTCGGSSRCSTCKRTFWLTFWLNHHSVKTCQWCLERARLRARLRRRVDAQRRSARHARQATLLQADAFNRSCSSCKRTRLGCDSFRSPTCKTCTRCILQKRDKRATTFGDVDFASSG